MTPTTTRLHDDALPITWCSSVSGIAIIAYSIDTTCPLLDNLGSRRTVYGPQTTEYDDTQDDKGDNDDDNKTSASNWRFKDDDYGKSTTQPT